VGTIFAIFAIVGLLTLIGSLSLAVFAYRYYWGVRGTPPLTGEERRLQKLKEVQDRSRQTEYAETHPHRPRSPNFWNNQKQ
jgi:hypothetical protein